MKAGNTRRCKYGSTNFSGKSFFVRRHLIIHKYVCMLRMYRHSIFDLVLMSYVNTFPPFYLEDHCDTNCPKDPQDPGGAL